MDVFVDKPRTSKMANGLISLAFSVIFYDTFSRVVVSNFRLMDGTLHGPAIRVGKTRTYLQTCYLDQPTAEKLYEAVKGSGWLEKYELQLAEPPLALAELTLTTTLAAKVAPALV